MKKWTALLLALVMCLSLAACGGKDAGNQDDSEAETTAQTAADKPTEPKSTATAEQAEVLSDDGVRATAELYLDLASYEVGSTGLMNKNAAMALQVDSVTVSGKELQIGMSLSEVEAAGFTPVEAGFGDISTNNTIRGGQFKDDSGASVSLGFMGNSIKSNGRLVTIGTYAYDSSNLAAVTVDQLSVGMSIGEALALYGEPDALLQGAMGDGKALQMRYYNEDTPDRLDIFVAPESGEVIGLVFQSAS